MSNDKKHNRPKYSLEFKQDATKLVLEKSYSQQQPESRYFCESLFWASRPKAIALKLS